LRTFKIKNISRIIVLNYKKMENGIITNGPKIKTRRIIRLVSMVFFSLLLLYYLFLSVAAPVKTFREIQKTFTLKDTTMITLINSNSKADSIARLSVVTGSRVIAAGIDSINFMLSLADSTLRLELGGVEIHNVKIQKVRYSKMLNKLSPENRYVYLSSPFYVKHYESTIAKVPIVIKHAPKDTAEANKINTVPVLPDDEFVHFLFAFDKHLILTVSQTEPATGHRTSVFLKTIKKNLKYFKEIWNSGKRFKIPGYIPHIEIYIPASDAKTIFRALPENAAMVLELN
jgi:hypothetical protein